MLTGSASVVCKSHQITDSKPVHSIVAVDICSRNKNYLSSNL